MSFVSEHFIFSICNLYNEEEHKDLFYKAKMTALLRRWVTSSFVKPETEEELCDLALMQESVNTESGMLTIYNNLIDVALKATFKPDELEQVVAMASDIEDAMAGVDTKDIRSEYSKVYSRTLDAIAEIFGCFMHSPYLKKKFGIEPRKFIDDSIAAAAERIKPVQVIETVETPAPVNPAPNTPTETKQPKTKKPETKPTQEVPKELIDSTVDQVLKQLGVSKTDEVMSAVNTLVKAALNQAKAQAPVEEATSEATYKQPKQQKPQKTNPAPSVEEVAQAAAGYGADTHGYLSKFVEKHKAQQPKPQPTPVQTQQPASTEQVAYKNPGHHHMPKGKMSKAGLWNANSLADAFLNERLKAVKEHFTFISGTHKNIGDTFINSLLSTVTCSDVLRQCRRKGVNIPDEGLTFTEIPLKTYANLIDVKPYDIAFRIDQTTRDNEHPIVYVSTKDVKVLTTKCFIPSLMEKRQPNNQQPAQAPTCSCGHC